MDITARLHRLRLERHAAALAEHDSDAAVLARFKGRRWRHPLA